MPMAASPPAVEVLRCVDRSQGRFVDAFDTGENLVVGPLSLVFRGVATVGMPTKQPRHTITETPRVSLGG